MTRDAIIGMLQEVGLAGQILEADMLALLPSFERFANLAIADFLERTGQYVTNDASREAAIAEAVADERAARIKAQIELRDMQEEMTKRAMQAEKDAYRRGVRDEQEACARAVERECIGFEHDDAQLKRIATDIRARR